MLKNWSNFAYKNTYEIRYLTSLLEILMHKPISFQNQVYWLTISLINTLDMCIHAKPSLIKANKASRIHELPSKWHEHAKISHKPSLASLEPWFSFFLLLDLPSHFHVFPLFCCSQTWCSLFKQDQVLVLFLVHFLCARYLAIKLTMCLTFIG